MKERSILLPFAVRELELAMGVVGLGATAATLLGVPGPSVVVVSGGVLAGLYVAGVLAHATSSRTVGVHIDGALRGLGYIRAFRRARKSLLLMHVDDDAPDDQLLGLYRTLLDQGVEIRRLIFVRPEHNPEGMRWIIESGWHARLLQRYVATDPGATLSLSFAIVDDSAVLLAVPGFDPTDTEPFSDRLVLRHLVELRNSAVTRAFLEVYESAWRRANPLELPRRTAS